MFLFIHPLSSYFTSGSFWSLLGRAPFFLLFVFIFSRRVSLPLWFLFVALVFLILLLFVFVLLLSLSLFRLSPASWVFLVCVPWCLRPFFIAPAYGSLR